MVNGQTGTPRIPHVNALDGARGLAVAGVLLFHGGHLIGGYLGVDFFFTLSGYLITSLLLAESNRTGSIGLGGFWARRARRLLPALAVLMVGVALYSWAFASPEQLAQIRGDALATLGYVANWHEIFSHQNYFALFSAPSPLNHTWSLAIEEQFYVIWPLLFVGLFTRFKRTTAQAVLVAALVLAAVSSALMIVLYDPANVTRAYFGTDTRAAAILFGAALAAWLTINGPTKKRNARNALEALGVIGAVVLAICWTRLDGQSSTLYRGGFLLCALAATAIIAAAVHPQPGPLSRILSLRPLCLLGLISYAVYLYHWPIDVFLDAHRVGTTGWPLFVIQTAITLALAGASYRIIEQPVRRGALTSIQWRRLTPAIAIALVLLLVAGTDGARTSPASTLGQTAILSAARTRRNAPPGARRILIVGDSVAWAIGPAFEQVHTDPPLAVVDAGIIGCDFPPQITTPPAPTPRGIIERRPCHPRWEARVVDGFRPDVVLWIVSDTANGAPRYHDRVLERCEDPYDSLYEQSLRKEISRLGAHGAQVVITTEAYARILWAANSDRIADCNNQLRRRVADETGAQLVDLFSYICPGGQCRVKQDGVTLRQDGQHYAGPGGKIVASWLLDQVDRTPHR